MFEYSENDAYDILLLDIEMGKMNGVELARACAQEKPSYSDCVYYRISGFYGGGL